MFAFINRRLSIYGRIKSKTGDRGWLPDGFKISAGTQGEADALLLERRNSEELSNAAFEEFMEMLRNCCDDPGRKYDKQVSAYLKKNHVLKLIDRTCEEIYYEDRGIDLIKLLDAAYEWATASNDVNIVKLGISLMGMLDLDDREDCRDAIVTLGKYEEFTLYSLYAVSEWKGARDIARAYKAYLKGWGKTHASIMLEPEAK